MVLFMKHKHGVVFILLGQSNAVGHGIPMKEDRITKPMKNVFGLHREDNQSFDMQELTWSGYTSGGMNLAEEQDHTYSVANCLARMWQDQIDAGNAELPDLYIIQIAIGAQGITDQYMWHPERVPKLVPGKLGTVDISLYPFTMHILSLLKDSFQKRNMTYEIMGVHWRGGENDITVQSEALQEVLPGLYTAFFHDISKALEQEDVSISLHLMACPQRAMEMDTSGMYLKNQEYINDLFCSFAKEYAQVQVFDVRKAPFYEADTRTHGLFMEDAVHYTSKTNKWVASEILKEYLEDRSAGFHR